MLRRLRSADVLAATAAIWFLAKFLRYAFPPLFPVLSARYGVTTATLGLAYTGMMLVYALLQFPSGALADRVGAARVIAVGAAVAALAACTLGVATPLVALVAAMACIGAGTGVHKTVSVRLLSNVYTERTGRALGVLDTIGAFGGVAAPAVVAALLATRGLTWHALFVGGGVVGLALAAVSYPRMHAKAPDPSATGARDGGGSLRRYAALFREPAFAAFVLVTIGYSFAYSGVVAFLPTFLGTAGLDPVTASAIYSVLFVVSPVQAVTGDLADRVGTLRVVTGTLALGSVGLLAVTFAGLPTLGLAVAVGVFGLGCHGCRPVRGAYLMETVPDDVSGGGLGVVRTVLMVAGALAPGVVGVLSGVAGYTVAFGLLCVALCAAAVGAFGLLLLRK